LGIVPNVVRLQELRRSIDVAADQHRRIKIANDLFIAQSPRRLPTLAV
jgi:acyl carrier protein phosphodiesterase